MIKSHLPVLLAKRRLKISDVSKDTGISRTTLASLYYERSKGVQFETLETLCAYLKCGTGDILEYEENKSSN